MPVKGGTTTPQERKFIERYALHGDAQKASIESGYRQASTGYKVLQRPAVNAEIVKAQQERLNNHLLPLAINALERLLTDKKTPAGAVVQASKLVLDKTLGGDNPEGKAPHEMTGDELQRALDRLRQEAAARAKPVIDAQPAQPSHNILD